MQSSLCMLRIMDSFLTIIEYSANTTTLILLVLTACLFLVLVCEFATNPRRKHMPPGPMGLPILGFLPFLPIDFVPKITQLFRKYGKIFSLRLGCTDAVFISDFEVMKRMTRLQVFSDRDEGMSDPDDWFSNSLCDVSGDEWKEQKRTSLRILRDVGNKQAFEDAVIDELQDLMTRIEDREGRDGGTDIQPLLVSSAANITNFLILGSRLPADDPERRVLESFVRQEDERNMFHVFFLPSWCQFLMPSRPPAIEAKTVAEILMRRSVEIEKKTKDASSQPMDCFISAYHKFMRKNSEIFDEDHLLGNASALYTAGGTTVSEFVVWFLILAMIDPVIQEKVRQEVDHVMGSSRPSLTHRKDMPYTSAVMHELHRFTPVGPLGLPQAVHQDVWLEGYFLPKGTNFFYSLFDVCRNPDYFPDPDEFMPERFMSQDGSFVRNEKVCSFGLGKRSCPGESTANILSFLFITSLVQKFVIEAPADKSYSMSGVCRFVSRVPADAPIRVVFKKKVMILLF